VIQQGTVLVRDGRIQAVGRDVSVRDQWRVIDVERSSLTPGLIDANARVETVDLIPASRKATPQSSDDGPAHEGEPEDAVPLAPGVRPSAVIADQASEVIPHLRVLDGLDLGSVDFQRLLRGGVTTVYVSPDASAVIGPRGAVLHTAGPSRGRVLVAAAAVKATIGRETWWLGAYNRRPSRFYPLTMYARRPNSRMGLIWVFRKAFYDAERLREGLPVYGADTASSEALEVIQQIRQGEVPLRIQARLQRDILTALRVAGEFDVDFTLEDATEAYKCINELKAAGVPVILGPIDDRLTGVRDRAAEGERPRYFTFATLVAAGIPVALSAQDLREEDGLARQAMYAVRFGARPEDALRAVTQVPARLLGLEKELGTVEPGKRADLVLWSGPPLAATSEVLLVLIDGHVVVDRRRGGGAQDDGN